MYTFFWNGPFSNWHITPMTVRDFEFNCCEQYFMTAKASMFQDRAIATQVVNTTDPKAQKALGRMINNFNKPMWDAISRDVMFRANFAKYTQNKDLHELLLSTQGELVEASPYDRLWGIGLSADDPRVLDKTKWKGKNWLGEILTEIRDSLR